MANLKALRDRLQGVGEYCQAEIWPAVDEFQLKHNVDVAGFKTKLIQSAPLIAGGWALANLIATSMSGFAKSVVSGAGGVAMLVGAIIIGREIVIIAPKALARFKALTQLQQEIKKKAVQFLDPTFAFEPQTSFPAELYQKSGLFPAYYDIARAEDRCSGKLGETQFEFVEISTFKKQESRDSRGHTTTQHIQVFKGLIFLADFNKNFQGHTKIQTDQAEKTFGGLARAAQRVLNTGSEKKLVELENPEFESRFKVTSTDETEARYLLTPMFMESVLALQKKFQANIQIAFMNSTLVVAIPHEKDFMAIDYGLKDVTSSVEMMLNEVVGLLEIVDDLELNTRIWNKTNEQVGA